MYGQPYRTVWYASEGQTPIVSPPALNADDSVAFGTLYVHHHKSAGTEGSQIWMYSYNQDQHLCWQQVSEGHPRKFSGKTYLLSLNKKHKPTWVQPNSFDRSHGFGRLLSLEMLK